MSLPGPRAPIYAVVLHCYAPANGNDKVYAVWVENRGGDMPFFVCGAHGKRTMTGMLKVDPKGSYSNAAMAHGAMEDVAYGKKKKGYKDVETAEYTSNTPNGARVLFENVICPGKVDTSRIIGYSTTATATPLPVVAPASRSVPKRGSKAKTGHAESGRSRRSISL